MSTLFGFGSREFDNSKLVGKFLAEFSRQCHTCLHGDAHGADRLVATWAAAYGMRVEAFPADWDTHGKRAGAIRTREIVERLTPEDVIVCFTRGPAPEPGQPTYPRLTRGCQVTSDILEARGLGFVVVFEDGETRHMPECRMERQRPDFDEPDRFGTLYADDERRANGTLETKLDFMPLDRMSWLHDSPAKRATQCRGCGQRFQNYEGSASRCTACDQIDRKRRNAAADGIAGVASKPARCKSAAEILAELE